MKLLVLISTVAVAVLAVAGGIVLYGSLSNDNVDDSDAISYSSDWKDYTEKLDQYGGTIIRAGAASSETSSTTRVSVRISVSINDVVALKGDLLEISSKTSQSYTDYIVIPLSQIQMIEYSVPQQS